MASSPSPKLKLIVFLGSVREGRNVLRVAKFVQKQLTPTYDLTLYDPLKLDLPLLKQPLHFYKNPADAPKELHEYEKEIRTADGYIVVSAEYNSSVPPALSNLLDHFSPATYAYKPTGLICYSMGRFGGIRAATQLRCLLAELSSVTVPTTFLIPQVHEALDEDGNPQNDHMESGLKRLMDQLDWYAQAMKNHRDKQGVPK